MSDTPPSASTLATLTAAYGDTPGDREMLSMAEERGYRVFSGKPA